MKRTDHISRENLTGKGIISIEGSEVGDCLLTNETHSIAWYDCCGSLGKYTNLLTAEIPKRHELLGSFRELLNSGKEFNLDESKSTILGLNRLFPKGKYNISVYDDYNRPFKPEPRYQRYTETSIVYGQVINKAKESDKITEWIQENKERANKGWHHSQILDLTCSNFYEGGESNYLVASQSKDLINSEIVREYKQIIQKGLRPTILVYNAWDISSDIFSNNYLIDGHHKMQAYLEAGIKPKILEFSEIEVDFKERKLNYYNLTNMYTWQLKHMFDNMDKNSFEFSEILSHKEHPLNKFVKNGEHEETWPDGKLKSRGKYKDDKEIGVIEYFYRNGRLKSRVLYEDGKQISYLNSWSNTGVLNFEIIPAEDVINGKRVSYYKDGKINQITYYKNGNLIDGVSSVAYHNNGKLRYEGVTLNNKSIESRYYDSNGKRTN